MLLFQVSNDEFSSAKASGQAGASREQKLRDFAAAYDSFMELKNNLEEGTKVRYCTSQLQYKRLRNLHQSRYKQDIRSSILYCAL